MEQTIAQRVERIRQFKADNHMSLRQFAERAGVKSTTIQGIDHDSWNPTLRTLIAIEEAIFCVTPANEPKRKRKEKAA